MAFMLLWSLVGISLTWLAVDAFNTDDSDSGDTSDTSDDIEGSPVPPPVSTDFLVAGGESVLGTDDADLFLRDPDADDYFNVTIDAGDGDDTLALYDPATDSATPMPIC